MAERGQQKFGAAHTQIKLGILRKYQPAFTTALKKTRFTLHYIDAFAGTGFIKVTISGRELALPGSAYLALHCDPPFHRMLFIENSLPKAEKLRSLCALMNASSVEVRHDDANIALPAYLGSLSQRDRALVFLDPFGMQVAWATLEKIKATGLADVWYLFPLSGLYRQAAKDSRKIDRAKEASLTRVMGPHDWRKALYGPPPQMRLFDEPVTDVRTADAVRIAEWVKGCLATTFPAVEGPKILYNPRGAPIFALFFLISNPDPRAIALARKIAGGILKT